MIVGYVGLVMLVVYWVWLGWVGWVVGYNGVKIVMLWCVCGLCWVVVVLMLNVWWFMLFSWGLCCGVGVLGGVERLELVVLGE